MATQSGAPMGRLQEKGMSNLAAETSARKSSLSIVPCNRDPQGLLGKLSEGREEQVLDSSGKPKVDSQCTSFLYNPLFSLGLWCTQQEISNRTKSKLEIELDDLREVRIHFKKTCPSFRMA
jgi:hypothetical protein